ETRGEGAGRDSNETTSRPDPSPHFPRRCSTPSRAPDVTEKSAPAKRARASVWYGLPIALASLVLCAFVAELAMRRARPWLLPEQKSRADADGLPLWLKHATKALRTWPPDLVIIGDSFVGTGDKYPGWIEQLRRSTGRRIAAFGLPGGCPSEYWLVLDRLRS